MSYLLKLSGRELNKEGVKSAVLDLAINSDPSAALAYAGVLENGAKFLREKHTPTLLEDVNFTSTTFHGVSIKKVAGPGTTTVTETKAMIKLAAQIKKQEEALATLKAQYKALSDLQIKDGNFTKVDGKPTIRVTVP